MSACATRRSWSASGAPSMRMIVIRGRRLATRSTKSPVAPASSWSTITRASARMPSSSVRTWRGANAFWTSPRSLACWGSSIGRNDCVASRNSCGASSNITPRPEQKVFGSREIARTSAWRTTAQYPPVSPSVGTSGLSGWSCQETGASARSQGPERAHGLERGERLVPARLTSGWTRRRPRG